MCSGEVPWADPKRIPWPTLGSVSVVGGWEPGSRTHPSWHAVVQICDWLSHYIGRGRAVQQGKIGAATRIRDARKHVGTAMFTKIQIFVYYYIYSKPNNHHTWRDILFIFFLLKSFHSACIWYNIIWLFACNVFGGYILWHRYGKIELVLIMIFAQIHKTFIECLL